MQTNILKLYENLIAINDDTKRTEECKELPFNFFQNIHKLSENQVINFLKIYEDMIQEHYGISYYDYSFADIISKNLEVVFFNTGMDNQIKATVLDLIFEASQKKA